MSQQDKSFFEENWIALVLTAVMLLTMGWIGYLMIAPNPTPRELSLEAVILSAASIVASFLVTKIYAEASYSQSLRDHGVQIASGVMVLKRQIEALTEWLAYKRGSLSGSENAEETVDGILEHAEQTLQGFRAMTDAALGGIAGVIGDALAQYETVMEQISRIRLEAVKKTTEIQKELQTAVSSADVVRLQAQIHEIAVQTESRISTLARTSALPIPQPPSKQSVTGECPSCQQKNTFEMPTNPGETQVITCLRCKLPFNAHMGRGVNVITRSLVNSMAAKRGHFEMVQYLAKTGARVDPATVAALIPIVISFHKKFIPRGVWPILRSN